MKIHNCAELGENLQEIIKRIKNNQNLLKLLYYEHMDPLNGADITQQIWENEIYGKLVRVVPKVSDKDTEECIIVIRVSSASTINSNTEFKNVSIDIESFVPLTSWIIKNDNLRPFLILGEIQKSLNNKKINGLGLMTGGNFELAFLTESVSCYEAHYTITAYD